MSATWYPDGPHIFEMFHPVVDDNCRWGSEGCPKCEPRPCRGHFKIGRDAVQAAIADSSCQMKTPPSIVIKETVRKELKHRDIVSSATIENLAKQLQLFPEQVRDYVDRVTNTVKKRKKIETSSSSSSDSSDSDCDCMDCTSRHKVYNAAPSSHSSDCEESDQL